MTKQTQTPKVRRWRVLAGTAAALLAFVGVVSALDRRPWERVEVDCATFKVDRAVWEWGLSGYDLPPDLVRPAERQFAGAVRCDLLTGLTEQQLQQRFAGYWSASPYADDNLPASLNMSPELYAELSFDSSGRVDGVKPKAHRRPGPGLPGVRCDTFRFDPAQWKPGALEQDGLEAYHRQLSGLVRCGSLIGLTPEQLSRKIPGGRIDDDATWIAGQNTFDTMLFVAISPLTGRAYDAHAARGN